jgi:hypothetical protein
VNDIKDGDQIFNPDLSNIYDYQFITNRIGMNYRYIGEKLNYTVGVNGQPAVLRGQNLSKDVTTINRTFNVIPSARLSYKFSNQESFDINYWGRNNQPGFFQLQPISDNSNLQNVVTGNPNLHPEFIHSINAHYKQSDWNAGHVLFANMAYDKTNNKIVTTTVRPSDKSVNQLTSYTNTNGFYSLKGDYYYSKPFAERKFSIGYSGWGQLNNNVSFTNDNRVVFKNAAWRQEAEFKVDIQDIVNLELEASYAQNLTTTADTSFRDSKTNRYEFQIEGRNYFFKDLTLGYDFTKQFNTGYDVAVRNPTILRVSLEYRFLKGDMGTLRLDGFDLFDQNSGISRDVLGNNAIVDRQVNRLGRYFMLSFIYRVRKFGG